MFIFFLSGFFEPGENDCLENCLQHWGTKYRDLWTHRLWIILRIPLQANVENIQFKVAPFNICTKEAVICHHDRKHF